MATPEKYNADNNNVEILDARVMFKNFRGEADQYTREGARSFHVVLTAEEAELLSTKGWNVKQRPPREEGDEPTYHLKVNVQFKTRGRPPRVMMITSKNKTRLDEGSVDVLDWARIISADIRIRPYEYETGKFSAYLVAMYATIEEDELESRYDHLPESGSTRAVDQAEFDEEDRF